jgi:outer membrane protein OmpA-like peptidoglycan-associated protein
MPLAMKRRICTGEPVRVLVSLGCMLLATRIFAGDPTGVSAELQKLQGNWPAALFSVDVSGLKDGIVQADQPLQVEYEAAQPGYVAYLRMTSHGEVSLTRAAPGTNVSGSFWLPPAASLGRERDVFIFANRPLDALFDGGNVKTVGSSPQQIQAFTQRLVQLQGQGALIATRRYDYIVDAPSGVTQYTTRSIIRQVEAGSVPGHPAGQPRFPARIEFEFDSDRLTDRGKRDLDVFGAALTSRLQDRKVTLEGHTDDLGTDQYNMDLSERRARAAKQYLIETFGITTNRIDVQGKGKEGAIGSNTTEADRSRNRRVDFVFASVSAAENNP